MSNRVWIRAHVEEIHEQTDYVSVPRDEWDAMTEQQRAVFVESVGDTLVANAGGYSAEVVEESEVPVSELTWGAS